MNDSLFLYKSIIDIKPDITNGEMLYLLIRLGNREIKKDQAASLQPILTISEAIELIGVLYGYLKTKSLKKFDGFDVSMLMSRFLYELHKENEAIESVAKYISNVAWMCNKDTTPQILGWCALKASPDKPKDLILKDILNYATTTAKAI